MKRKNVAVFISALYEDMVRETVEGLLSAARGEDVKITFFASFADNHTSQNYDRYQLYDTGDFVVYLLPDLRDIFSPFLMVAEHHAARRQGRKTGQEGVNGGSFPAVVVKIPAKQDAVRLFGFGKAQDRFHAGTVPAAVQI